MNSTLRAILAVVALLTAGCMAPTAGARVSSFRVDEPHRAFSLVIEEPGAPAVRIDGDAAGGQLRVSVGGVRSAPAEAERRRRQLHAHLDAQIERLDGVPGAEADLAWIRAFRTAYSGAPR